jgi:hypothetical protein
MTPISSLMCRTTARSWAMTTYVSPSRDCSSSSRLTTCACTETSSADTGSSAMTSSGSSAIARAMPIRWRCPPLNSCGYFDAADAGSPTTSRSSCTRAATPTAALARWARIGSTSSDSTSWRGSRLAIGSWNTICMRRRDRRSSSR